MLNLDNVLRHLRGNGCKVRINHYRRASLKDGKVDCYPLHEIDGNYFTLLNNGGFTTVEVTMPDGTVLRGKHNFSAHKPFVRRIGVTAALGRAFGNIYFLRSIS